MSIKTDRLVRLFPDAYAAREGASLLHRLLDAVGAELMSADGAVKQLLKSHWVDYAQADALDGLAATFGVARRRLVDGTPEPDDSFRRRLKGVVPFFTGGGTVKAVEGAVRSALGLPFDLELFGQEIAGPGVDPVVVDTLIGGLAELVRVQEYSPKPESALSAPVTKSATVSEVTVEIDFASVLPTYPRIAWTFTAGGARFLTMQRLDTGQGIKSRSTLRVNPAETLYLTADGTGAIRVEVAGAEVTGQFTAWDGVGTPRMPPLPGPSTQWKFTAMAATFDYARFDDTEGFDLPEFSVRFDWTRRLPLTFDVIVPYYIGSAVELVRKRAGYQGSLQLFEGLPLEVIQSVVEQTRAAGVRGRVHFTLNFAEDHATGESVAGLLEQATRESQDVLDTLAVGSINTGQERHDASDTLALGAVFDISTYDGSFGFHG
jgi:hypothetical protein